MATTSGSRAACCRKLHHHVERFVGVVDDEVLLPDRGKAIAAVIAHPLRIARRIGNEFKIRPVEVGELRHLVERQHAIDHEHVLVGDAPSARCTKLRSSAGIGRLDVEADDRCRGGGA